MFSVIIPNYNGVEHLKTCFESLSNQTINDFKIILVDNGSEDNSVAFTKSYFKDSHVIELGYNSGFAKAVNEGVKYSLKHFQSNYILLLNNDIELSVDFLEIGLKTFKTIHNAASVAVKMLNYFNREVIDDCGDFIKSNGGSPLARGHGEKDTGQYDKEEFIFGACAGAAFYRKEVFESIGFFDENFFAYYEDIDFSFRAQFAGFKCFYQPKAVCYHKRGGTSSIATHGFQTEMCERNLVLLRFKNYPLSIYFLYQPLFFIARIKRYYSFLKLYPFPIFLKAVKGYSKGIFLLLFQLKKRFEIQKSKNVENSYIKNLFSK